jgi:hypothetical protein
MRNYPDNLNIIEWGNQQDEADYREHLFELMEQEMDVITRTIYDLSRPMQLRAADMIEDKMREDEPDTRVDDIIDRLREIRSDYLETYLMTNTEPFTVEVPDRDVSKWAAAIRWLTRDLARAVYIPTETKWTGKNWKITYRLEA